MRALLKRLEWVVTGEAGGGKCHECGEFGIVVRGFEYECEFCGAGDDIPEPPRWL